MSSPRSLATARRWWMLPALLCCLWLAPSLSVAQPVADSLSPSGRISLITVLPGDALYSMYGHSAFRVYDPLQGLDLTYNYGTFHFGNPVTFGLRFMRGQLDYMLGTVSFPDAAAFYARVEHRSIIEQILNLTPAERNAVFRFLQVNARPENRTYRYDFLFDNCSTRLRDVLEDTLGEDVRFTQEPGGETSFRELLDPYAADKRWLDLGYDLLLGLPTDRIATPREATFLPINLMQSFAQASVLHGGAAQPLVAQTDTLHWVPGADRLERSFPWPAAFFWLLFALGMWLSVRAYRGRPRLVQAFDAALFGAAGVAGVLICIMWFLTEHTVTRGNLNLLWAWPTHLIAAVALVRSPGARWLRPYWTVAAVVTLVVLAGWAFWPQTLHPALIPVCLLLLLRCGGRVVALRSFEL